MREVEGRCKERKNGGEGEDRFVEFGQMVFTVDGKGGSKRKTGGRFGDIAPLLNRELNFSACGGKKREDSRDHRRGI